MINKLRVLILNEPAQMNAINWYRLYRPLTLLERQYQDLEITWNRGVILPQDFMNADVVIAMHVSNYNHVVGLMTAKKHGCRIILDFDDDLLNVPVSHGVYTNVGQSANAVRQAVEMADVVWVTTEALGKSLNAKKWVIVPNAVLPEDLPDEPNPIKKRMVWRGSVMSFYDLWNKEFHFEKIMDKTDEFIWYGYQPPFRMSYAVAQKVAFYPFVDFSQYFERLRDFQANIIWKPLEPIPFNAAKSNIAWIEATCAGAVCMTDSWRVQRCTDWQHCIDRTDYREDFIRAAWLESRDVIEQFYNLNKINELRYHSLVGTLQTSI